MINSAQEPVTCQITEWERTFDLELIGEWEPELWNARVIDINHPIYSQTMDSIKQVIDYYQIQTEIEACQITPLHYLFAKCIKDESMTEKLLKKLQAIDPKIVNIRNIFKLTKVSDNPREIDSDSFLDGGVFLLWCLQNNRTEMLNHMLGEIMVQVWRFA